MITLLCILVLQPLPKSHIDECPADYLKRQEIPMVIVSHDREFLDQLCTKIVETELGVSTTYKGNYSQYMTGKSERNAQQYSAWEKQQKEIARLVSDHDL